MDDSTEILIGGLEGFDGRARDVHPHRQRVDGEGRVARLGRLLKRAKKQDSRYSIIGDFNF